MLNVESLVERLLKRSPPTFGRFPVVDCSVLRLRSRSSGGVWKRHSPWNGHFLRRGCALKFITSKPRPWLPFFCSAWAENSMCCQFALHEIGKNLARIFWMSSRAQIEFILELRKKQSQVKLWFSSEMGSNNNRNISPKQVFKFCVVLQKLVGVLVFKEPSMIWKMCCFPSHYPELPRHLRACLHSLWSFSEIFESGDFITWDEIRYQFRSIQLFAKIFSYEESFSFALIFFWRLQSSSHMDSS